MYFYSLLWLFELAKFYFEAINKYTIKYNMQLSVRKTFLKTGESYTW